MRLDRISISEFLWEWGMWLENLGGEVLKSLKIILTDVTGEFSAQIKK